MFNTAAEVYTMLLAYSLEDGWNRSFVTWHVHKHLKCSSCESGTIIRHNCLWQAMVETQQITYTLGRKVLGHFPNALVRSGCADLHATVFSKQYSGCFIHFLQLEIESCTQYYFFLFKYFIAK